jgi:hypothetical protein
MKLFIVSRKWSFSQSKIIVGELGLHTGAHTVINFRENVHGDLCKENFAMGNISAKNEWNYPFRFAGPIDPYGVSIILFHTLHNLVKGTPHKVLIYIEYRAVFGVFRTIDPPPPFHPASVSSPRTKGGEGTHSPGGEGVGGQYFGRRQTLDWPLTV